MSKLLDKLRERGVCNDYEFFGDQPYYYYRTKSNRRDVIPKGWVLVKKGRSLSDWWGDHGCKRFTGQRAEAELECQQFITKNFGVKEFDRAPTGGRGDALFIKERLRILLALPPKPTNA